jgi:subtilase family serine protease
MSKLQELQSKITTLQKNILEIQTVLNDLIHEDYQKVQIPNIECHDIICRHHYKTCSHRVGKIAPHDDDLIEITDQISDEYVYYGPTQIRKAYGMDLIETSDHSPLGSGQKVAITIAYHYPRLQEDLDTYCRHFNLPLKQITVINLGSNYCDEGWAQECCLDVQAVYTMAPGADILVIEAASPSFEDLGKAVERAVQEGSNVINMSWGSNEFQKQREKDILFNNSNVVFVASSGDTTETVSYPSSSSLILSVGGSKLTLDKNDQRVTEDVWSSSGAGFSKYEMKPSYQNTLNSTTKYRATPDICFTADPDKGFAICYNQSFYIFGGSSLSSPLAAGMIAVANQFRLLSGKHMLSSHTSSPYCIQNYLYRRIYPNHNLYLSVMYDITTGIDGHLRPTKNYDVATGLGAPKCNSLILLLQNL